MYRLALFLTATALTLGAVLLLVGCETVKRNLPPQCHTARGCEITLYSRRF